ncbi:MAG TPA: PAS domain S-box protein [Gaiellaceae bacterium]
MDGLANPHPAQLLLERLPLVPYLLPVDGPGSPLYVGPQFEEIFGYPTSATTDDPEFWLAHIVPEHRDLFRAGVESVRAGNGAMSLEYQVACSDGRVVWVRDIATLEGDAIHGYLVDVTREKELEHELALQRGTLDAFFRDASMGLAITDEDGRYVRINDALAAINGAPIEAHIGRTLTEVAPAIAEVVDPLRAAAGPRERFEVEIPHTGKQTVLSYFPFEVGGRRYHGRVVVDVTDQRRAEAAERRLRLLLEQLPLAVYVNDASDGGRVVSYVSPRIEELTGYSPEAFAADPTLGDKIIHPYEFETIVEMERASRSDAQVFEHEYRIIRADGEVRWVLDRMETVFDDEGKALYEQGFLVDVTESHETANLLRAVWDGALEALHIADDDGRYIDVNPAACELLGRSREELLTMRVDDITGGSADAWRNFRERGVDHAELSIERPNGEWREIEAVGRADVLPGRHLIVVRDVTERKQLERELWRSQKLESVGRLAGGVAHDFNNLLTAIRGFAQLLEARTAPGSVERHHAGEIDRAADRAAALTAQLLALGRRQTMNVRPLDLNRQLEGMRDSLVELAGAEVEVEFALDPTLHAVRVDSGLIAQAISNLVGNAVDALPDGGRIVLETENADVEGREDLADGSYVVLHVADDGRGIDPANLEHVFEPFFTTKGVGEGSGLGLASAYGTVRQSGGTITVDSEPGHGATFSIYLPEASAVDSGPAPAGGGETVLVVERDPAVRDMVFETLTDAGYRVLAMRTTVEARRLLDRHVGSIDLIVSERSDALAGVRAPVVELAKPYTPERLHRAVRDALASPKRVSAAPVSA